MIKQSAASPDLLQHRGKAYVFENHEDMESQVDQDYLPIDRNTILVMKNGGPKARRDSRSGDGFRCRACC